MAVREKIEMSKKNIILASFGFIGALYLGYNFLNAFLIFSCIFLVGMLIEIIFSMKSHYFKPVWETTIYQKNNTIFYKDKKSNLFSFLLIEHIPQSADLLHLLSLNEYNFQFVENNGSIFLALIIKAPRTRNLSEIEDFSIQKTQDFVETVKLLVPNIVLTPINVNCLIANILSFNKHPNSSGLEEDFNNEVAAKKHKESDVTQLFETLLKSQINDKVEV